MHNKSLMVCQELSIATSWQISGMNIARLSCREIGRQLAWNHIVISRRLRKYQHTNDGKDNIIKHFFEKTGRYYLFYVAHFPAA